MNFDISELVRDTLLSQGCAPGMLESFDGHSTIALEFNGIPDILVSLVDEQVVIWCRLLEHNPGLLEQCADRLLPMLMTPVFYSITGQLQLAEDSDYTVLKSVLHPSCLNPDDFGRTLEEFYQSIEDFLKVFQ